MHGTLKVNLNPINFSRKIFGFENYMLKTLRCENNDCTKIINDVVMISAGNTINNQLVGKSLLSFEMLHFL